MKIAYLRNGAALVVLILAGFLLATGNWLWGIVLLLPVYLLVTTDLSY